MRVAKGAYEKLTTDYATFAPPAGVNFFLVAPAGAGEFTETFIAICGTKACILRLFLGDSAAATKMCEKEFHLWSKISGLGDFVKSHHLNNTPAITLPCFEVDCTQRQHLPEVQAAVERAIDKLLDSGHWVPNCAWRDVGLFVGEALTAIFTCVNRIVALKSSDTTAKSEARVDMKKQLGLDHRRS